ncbi:MAG: phage Gp37/Gp68 family protein [Mesorhizobium sp.]|uniref:DUF5131 family protein n=1 Tax=Mesorhizobium sp. M7A.F.Ca.ET.027.02.1.1 TaxID=2496655 RepID=UPI000FD5B501|nr:phage Gp37/Gp68 family protein [Mesorhizobium sp. M7A.F.Ca.ET.027.02.1.1]RVD13946.1 phage Gp37/Gp68 family protein [Mesorhizobium sp. M7A.F.Ca.ET.027.02.1.1]RWC99175.1 MAG: phage Gp37/Gp68 family protein [Mesorhizobium sp.]
MADKSAIEWTDATWNPIVGCSILSPGCTHCYAMRMAGRIEAMGGAKHYAGTTKKVNGNTVWTGKLAMAPEHILMEPLTWRTPRKIFVNSMGDLFHEDVPDEWIDKVFAIMALAPQHTFQVLTKRATRMREYMLERWQPAPAHRLAWPGGDAIDIPAEATGETREDQVRAACEPFLEKLGLVDTDNDDLWTEDGNAKAMTWTWPLANVWLGVSAERQQEADERIPELLATPAAIRFVSAEPLLGPIDFTRLRPPVDKQRWGFPNIDALRGTWFVDGHRTEEESPFEHALRLDWIIVGGESGPDARPMHPAWARSIRDQCAAADVPFFFKQWGEWVPICAMDDGQSDRYFDPPPERDPEAIRRCRIGQCIMHADGERFDLDQWSRNLSKRATHAFTTGNHAMHMFKVGKKAAGRMLDGVEHNGMPELR